jgi:hopanoid C-3 methylase
MKILMFRPKPSPETIGLQHLMVVEPLELEILSALKRPHDKVIIIDLIIEKRSFLSFVKEHNPRVVCLTGYITNVNTILKYCRQAKDVDTSITTIVGGVHCEVCPEDFDHPSVDYRVVRNAAKGFTALLDHIEHRTPMPQGVFKTGHSTENTPLPPFDFTVPFPDREAVARYRHKYFYIFHKKVALIKTSFGCPFQCNFCFCRVITQGKYHQRPLDEIIQELESIKESEIYIVDDDFLIDRKWLGDFFTELRKCNIHKHYLVYGRADFIARNPDIMHEFALLGLRTVIVGFESFSDQELDTYNKNTSVQLYHETMAVLNREKIDVFATIIIPPHWGKADFSNMVKVVKSLGIHFVNLQPLTPLPKTGVNFIPQQIIIPKTEYEKWDLAHVSIQPTQLTVAEFYQEILNAYNKILYSPPVMWKYLTTYSPVMLFKMLVGGFRVTRQYHKKIKEAQKNA